uniref:Uncharacterized protein n=1 Tax=Mycena chlorophos TaxID=658473 RepID=A0ABQ0MBM9_MYCCL|nr:predicted protein [Mycena chlorophos]
MIVGRCLPSQLQTLEKLGPTTGERGPPDGYSYNVRRHSRCTPTVGTRKLKHTRRKLRRRLTRLRARPSIYRVGTVVAEVRLHLVHRLDAEHEVDLHHVRVLIGVEVRLLGLPLGLRRYLGDEGIQAGKQLGRDISVTAEDTFQHVSRLGPWPSKSNDYQHPRGFFQREGANRRSRRCLSCFCHRAINQARFVERIEGSRSANNSLLLVSVAGPSHQTFLSIRKSELKASHHE